MEPLDYLHKYQRIYEARETRRRFIPLEKIAKNPRKYGYSFLIERLPKNYVSNAKQEAFLRSKAKITAAICANRGGKSEVLAIKALRNLESIKIEQGGRYWILTESFDLQKAGIQTKINIYFKPERIVPSSISYVKKGVYHSFDYINKWGVRIPVEFKTYEQGVSKLQAAKLYGASIDEEPPEEIYDEVRTRTVDLQGPIDFGFTPLKGFTWSYRRLFNANTSNVNVYNWGMADNPFIPSEEIADMRRDYSVKKFNMRGKGLFQGSEGMIYESFERGRNVRPNLFDERFPVSVSIDWGIVCVSIGFFQQKTITSMLGTVKKENYLFDAMEITGAGYGQVMKAILAKQYYIPADEWFCDPAGRARSQATKTGVSLLQKIKKDYGIDFRYIKRVGVEESIDMVDSMFLNANQESRMFIQKGIKMNARGDTPEMRIEGYVRDDKNNQPIKDGINDHFCDMLRYYVVNKLREEVRPGIRYT